MLTIEQNRALKPLTTFKIGGPARYFVEITNPAELVDAFDFAETKNLPVLVLGGGSNMLVSDSGFGGLVIHVNNRGISVGKDESERMKYEDFDFSSLPSSFIPHPSSMLKVASGETWDDVVKFAVQNNLWGIENLSRIPGQAGAVAVQNVGAYGQEIANVLMNVEVFDRKTKSFRRLSNEECRFSYRKSIFNTSEKNRYIILYTTLALSDKPNRNLSYPDVKKRFENNPNPSLEEIRQAIKEIRDRKFPFPAESIEGNAGSFFKNSLISPEQFENLRENFEHNLPEHLERLLHYLPSSFTPHPSSLIKIPSAFILESCGLKGFRRGNVQLNPSQPVVVLNLTGEATADEVLSVIREVRAIVEDKTGLHLYTEPEMIGFSAEEFQKYGFSVEELERFL